jgi:hypothetical protein
MWERSGSAPNDPFNMLLLFSHSCQKKKSLKEECNHLCPDLEGVLWGFLETTGISVEGAAVLL